MADDQALSDDATDDFGSIGEQSVTNSDAATRRRSARPVKRAVPLDPAEDEVAAVEVSDATARIEAVRASRPVRRTSNTALATTTDETHGKTTEKKGRPTKSRDEVADTDKRVGPAEFTRQSIAELRKVVWPTGGQLGRYFLVVLLFVLFIITYVGLLDVFFGWGLLKLLGK